ncbi:membrane protein [Xanthomonas fragariae LMG 25863]|nr:membrane protein [Xanthomonas fragariae LMG 25863]
MHDAVQVALVADHSLQDARVSLQKSVRDRVDGIPVTGLYYAIFWFSLIIALVLLAIGLINATLLLQKFLRNGICTEPVGWRCGAEEHSRCDGCGCVRAFALGAACIGLTRQAYADATTAP